MTFDGELPFNDVLPFVVIDAKPCMINVVLLPKNGSNNQSSANKATTVALRLLIRKVFGWSELVNARSPVDSRADAPVASSSGALLCSLSGSVVRCSQLLRPYVFAYLFRYYIVIAAASIASKPGPVLSLDAMDKLCCKANFKTMIRLSSNSLDLCHRRGDFAVH